jgi:methyl-accepting chemotaxis protein
MIEQIKANCEAETLETCRILEAMEEIGATLTNNLASAQAANQASSMLIHQVDFLLTAVNQFKHVNSQSVSPDCRAIVVGNQKDQKHESFS